MGDLILNTNICQNKHCIHGCQNNYRYVVIKWEFLPDVVFNLFLKQLETELRKLQSIIQESMQGFDDNLTQLFMKKIKIMMVIYQVSPTSFF